MGVLSLERRRFESVVVPMVAEHHCLGGLHLELVLPVFLAKRQQFRVHVASVSY